MKYKATVQISNDVSDTYLSKGDVFELEKVHIQQTGVSWAEIAVQTKRGDNRDRPELITVEVLDQFCEEVKDAKSKR